MSRWLVYPLLATGGWVSLWLTPDQAGDRLLKAGQPKQAAELYNAPMRQGVAWYRAGEVSKAEKAFALVGTADAEFNRGNCLVFQGQYDEAIARYDRALELRPDWDDAVVNRKIAMAGAEAIKREGGDMGDQKIGADEVKFDRNKKEGGQDTEIEKEQAIQDQSVQAIWLRRMQTSPADFLKAKFSYQVAAPKPSTENGGKEKAP